MTHLYTNWMVDETIRLIKLKRPEFSASEFIKQKFIEFQKQLYGEDIDIDFIKTELKKAREREKEFKETGDHLERQLAVLEIKQQEEQKQKQLNEIKEQKRIFETHKKIENSIKYMFQVADYQAVELAKEVIAEGKEDEYYEYLKEKGIPEPMELEDTKLKKEVIKK